MALTAEQRTARRQYIGSSDAAAILGLDPFRSAADVFLEKTGQLEAWEGNEATDRGRLLEPVLLDWAEGELRCEFRRDVMVVHPNGLLCTNFDGLIPVAGAEDVRDDGAVYQASVEAKTTVIEEGWGEPGTDDIPDRVIAQAHHGFACVPSLEVCWVPVLLPTFRKFDFRLYRVERNQKLVETVEATCADFMERHVRLGIRPDDFRPSIDVLKRIRRQPNKTVPLADEIVDEWIAAKAAERQAESDCEAAQARLLAAMGDAEAGEFGRGAITYFETHRKAYAVKATTYRQLRIKKTKGAVSE